MNPGANRRSRRSWRGFLQRGKEIVADLDALPASEEVWKDQRANSGDAERPSPADPYEDSTVTPPAVAEPPAWALGWWADPPPGGTTLRLPTQRGRAVRQVQASIRGRRILP